MASFGISACIVVSLKLGHSGKVTYFPPYHEIWTQRSRGLLASESSQLCIHFEALLSDTGVEVRGKKLPHVFSSLADARFGDLPRREGRSHASSETRRDAQVYGHRPEADRASEHFST